MNPNLFNYANTFTSLENAAQNGELKNVFYLKFQGSNETSESSPYVYEITLVAAVSHFFIRLLLSHVLWN